MEFLNAAIAATSETTGGTIFLGVGAVVAAAKCITILTPTKSDDAILGKILGFLNILALNIGKDRNKDG